MLAKYAIISAFLGQLRDRFSVYQSPRTIEEKLAAIGGAEGIDGVEMAYPDEVGEAEPLQELLARYGVELAAVNVNLKGDPRWRHGALTARDAETRREAVSWLRQGMDLAAELGAGLVTICPLADGHDYPFEVDYVPAWRDCLDSLRAAADYRPDVRLSLEYKPSEPRARVILGNADRALLACSEIDRANVGVTLDLGHALYAGESCAESAALLAHAGRLFHVHSNDNYRNWDWDMVPGSVNLIDLVETTFYLERIGYGGWTAFDVFPARLDPMRAMDASMRMHALAEGIVARAGRADLERCLRNGDPLEALALVRAGMAEAPIMAGAGHPASDGPARSAPAGGETGAGSRR